MTMVRFQLAVLALEVGSVHACKKENEQEQNSTRQANFAGVLRYPPLLFPATNRAPEWYTMEPTRRDPNIVHP